MKTFSPRNSFLLLVIVGQLFLHGYRWLHCDPMTSDFPYFFSVTRLYESGHNPYDLNAQCQDQASLREDECAGYAHAPFILPLLSAVFNNDFNQSYWRWAVFQLCLLVVCVWLLYVFSENTFASLQCAVFPPIIGGLLMGNDTIFILTALLGFSVLLLNKKDLWAGAVLAFVTLKPQLALPLAVPLLLVRPKAFLGFCIGGLTLVLFSFLVVGLDGLYGMVQIMRSLSKGSTFGGVSQAYMFNITGLLARLGMNTFWAWPIYLTSLTGMTFYLKHAGITKRSLSLVVLLAVFTSPYLFLYDFAYLVLPLAYVHPLALAVASIVTGLLIVGLPWWTVYLLVGALGYGLIRKARNADPSVCLAS